MSSEAKLRKSTSEYQWTQRTELKKVHRSNEGKKKKPTKVNFLHEFSEIPGSLPEPERVIIVISNKENISCYSAKVGAYSNSRYLYLPNKVRCHHLFIHSSFCQIANLLAGGQSTTRKVTNRKTNK